MPGHDSAAGIHIYICLEIKITDEETYGTDNDLQGPEVLWRQCDVDDDIDDDAKQSQAFDRKPDSVKNS